MSKIPQHREKVIPVIEMLPASLGEIRLSTFWGSVERSVRRAHLLLDLLSHCRDAGVHPVSEGEARKQHHVSLSTAAWPSFRNMASENKNKERAVARLSRHYLATQQSPFDDLATVVVVVVVVVLGLFLITVQSDEPVFL